MKGVLGNEYQLKECSASISLVKSYQITSGISDEG